MKRNKTSILKSDLLAPIKTGVDNKLTQAAMVLQYAFEYMVNFQARVITITGVIDEGTYNTIEAALTEMEAQSRKAITIKINSPGGDVLQALAIVGRMKRSHCQIITEGYGAIMSAATLILAAGNKRRISKYSYFMHHEASYEIGGRHSSVKAEVKQIEISEKQWNKWMAEFTKQPATFWDKNGVHIDAYFTPEQLVEYGVADEII